MKKSYLAIQTLLIYSVIFLTSSHSVFAAKARIQPKGKATTTTATGFVSPKLRKDRLAINVYFYNLTKYKSVNYTLMYNANGVDQGVQGSAATNQYSATRELLFGTCSKNVCTYHKNITGMTLEVNAVTKDGKNVIKKYKVKV